MFSFPGSLGEVCRRETGWKRVYLFCHTAQTLLIYTEQNTWCVLVWVTVGFSSLCQYKRPNVKKKQFQWELDYLHTSIALLINDSIDALSICGLRDKTTNTGPDTKQVFKQHQLNSSLLLRSSYHSLFSVLVATKNTSTLIQLFVYFFFPWSVSQWIRFLYTLISNLVSNQVPNYMIFLTNQLQFYP